MVLRNTDLHEDLEVAVHWVRTQPTAELRADAAITTMKMLRTHEQELARIRVAALRELVETGWGYNDIAAQFGITRQRVEQLVNS